MTLVDRLSYIFKFRITRNEDIPSFMKRLSDIGKFDEPKKNLVITELLIRVADLEEKVRLLEPSYTSPITSPTLASSTPAALPISPSILSWKELVEKGKAMEVYKVGISRSELEALIVTKQ